MKGGNTDNVYNDGTNREAFVDALVALHPDCVKKVWRYKRWHHDVDYPQFKTELRLKGSHEPRDGANEYGMRLVPNKKRLTS
jgi:hypothetical protein